MAAPEAFARLARALRPAPRGGTPELLARLARPAGREIVAFVNAHAANLAAGDPAFLDDLLAADHLLRDGKGMELLLARAGMDPGENLNGTDLIPRVLAAHAGRPVALFGTGAPWLERAAARIRETHPVGAVLDGFQPDTAYAAALAAAPAELVILAMGMPKQERVARALREAGGPPCLIVCGGAILDFLAGRHPRAPGWMRAAGLEWLFRLAREPRRLFSRYVVGNAVFLWRARGAAALLRAAPGRRP